MKINEYMEKEGLILVDDDAFNRLYISGQEMMNDFMNIDDDADYYFRESDESTDGEHNINQIYEIIKKGPTMLDTINTVLNLRNCADDMVIVAEDDDAIMIEYWWN